MSSWLIDITSFIRIVSDDEPTEEEARGYIKEEIGQLIDNSDVKVTHC